MIAFAIKFHNHACGMRLGYSTYLQGISIGEWNNGFGGLSLNARNLLFLGISLV